jgi:hypothetical protein
MSKHPMKDLVVVLPGILGSALEKDGKTIWDMSSGAAIRALLTLGGSVKDLALDGDDHSADDLGDGVRATRLVPDLHLIPGLWKIDGYGAITRRLLEQFDLVSGENYFEFAYDWRRDNRVAARKLARASHDWLKAWRDKSGNEGAKLVLLAHSMGGLVSRAFLELEEGWKDTRTLVTFGTPYRGSLNAAGFIANGFKKKVGPLTVVDLTDMLRSLTSVYQLLPIYPCIDEGGDTLARLAEAKGFPNLDTARAGAALAFHRAIEGAVNQHSTETAYVENGYRIEPVVGTDQPTFNSGRIDGDRLLMSRSIDGERLLGDGTVPRPSAHPQESDDAANAVFSGEPHASIQNQRGILDHVAGLMTVGALDLGRFRKPSLRLGLILDDIWEADVGAELTVETNETTGDIGVEVIDAATSEVAARVADTGRGAERLVQIPGLPAGAYRVRASSSDTSATDIVLVA